MELKCSIPPNHITICKNIRVIYQYRWNKVHLQPVLLRCAFWRRVVFFFPLMILLVNNNLKGKKNNATTNCNLWHIFNYKCHACFELNYNHTADNVVAFWNFSWVHFRHNDIDDDDDKMWKLHALLLRRWVDDNNVRPWARTNSVALENRRNRWMSVCWYVRRL